MLAPRVLLFALLVGAVTSACTSFDAIDRGVCGNGIVEAGEDCDSSDATCVRCAVVCQSAGDCPNAAYTCGTDGLCAAPSGELGLPVVAGAFQVEDVTVTDIDRDGIGDVLGVSSTSLSLRFGDPSARLERSQSVLTPPHISAPAFGDMDGDGATDVAYASTDGLVAYGSRFAALAPLASSKALLNSTDGSPLDIKRIVKLSRRSFIALVDGGAAGAALVTFDEYSGFTISAPCLQAPGNVTYDQLDVDTLDVYSASDTDAVVAIRINAPTPRYCMMAFHLDVPALSKPPAQVWKSFDITPATLPAGTKKLFLADQDFDSNQDCPGIVSEETGFANVKYWDGTTVAQHCAFDAGGFSSLTALPSPVAAGEHIIGLIALDPGIAFCAHDIIATNDGLWLYVNFLGITGWGNIYQSTRQLVAAASGDFDGDGLGDGALVAADEDDIDIVYRKNDPVNTDLPAFILYRIDTTSKVSHLAVGDFDGNGYTDLAFDERLDGFDRISVAYDHHDFLSPPVQVAAIEAVDDIVPLPIPSAEDSSAITTDLFILEPPGSNHGVPALAILLGSTLGTMIPVIDPRQDDGPAPRAKVVTHMASVVIGKFLASTVDDLHDLLLFAPLNAPPANMPSSPPAWRLAGTSDGPDGSVTQPVTTTGFADCAGTDHAGLCIAQAQYLAWPDGATDAMIAVDRDSPPHAVSFEPSAATIAATPLTAISSSIVDKAPVRSLQRADLDGDGTDELIVVASARGESTGTDAILVCTMDGLVPTSCVDIAGALLDTLATDGTPARTCVDAAPAHLRSLDRTSTDEQLRGVDLVVACLEEAADGTVGSVLYRVTADGSYTLLARTSTRIAALHVGDVTGDGVEDVLAIEGDQGVETLVVFPQCSSRNAAACGGGK